MKAGDYIKAVEGAIINQPKYWAKHHNERVAADSGTVTDKTPEGQRSHLTDYYKFLRETRLIDNLVFSWDSSSGIKERTSGANTFATKLYDMSSGNKDAVQATEANQPFVGGGIAPSEKKRLKNLSTVSTRGLTHTQISFSATDNWSVTTILKGFENISSQSTGMYAGDIGTGKGLYFYRGGNRIALFDGVNEYSTNDITSFLNSNIGKSMLVTWVYASNAVLLFVNGVQFSIISTFSQFNFVFNVLFQNVSGQRNLAGEIYYHQIFNKALSASEIQAQHAYLRLQYPEIEGIDIGNQHWATSNYEGVVTGNGTVIPEVQLSTSTELITNEADRTFSEDTGFWVKIGEATIAGGVLNILSTTGAASGIQKTLLTIGKIYQLTYTVSRYGSGAIKSDCINGAGTIPSSVGTHTIQFISISSVGHIGRVTPCDVDISDISFKEVGWSDLTTPAWCYYGNDPLNGAIYGKLYNWYAVQAIAANPPAGWRVPTQADFTQLANFLGGSAVAGGKLKKEGLNYFDTPNTDADNSSGFSAIGAGVRREALGFGHLKNYISFASSDKVGNGYGYILIKNSAAFQRNDFIFVVTEKTGQSIRLIRNEPVGATERNIETGYITNALGATNLDIPIPFGYQVESVRIDSETNITGLSAKLLTGALVELETLFTAKSVTANVQKVIAADADQSIQQTDAVVRINGTKANTASRFRVWVKLTKVVFS